MYSSDPRALQIYGEHAHISPELAKTARDKFYPKSMLQLGEVKGLNEMMQDAIAFKYLTQPLTPEQQKELLQLQRRK